MKTTLPIVCLTIAVAVQGFAPLPQARHHSPSVALLEPAALRMSSNPLEELLSGIFKSGAKATTEPEPEPEPELPDVVIEPDFKLAAIFLGLGVLLDTIPYIQLVLGPLVTVLGLLFLVQTFRIRFTFDKEAFELKQGDSLKDIGDNIVVGGANRWTYDSFVNYDFFPKGWIDQPQGPILVYFKETQTPSDNWNEGPGKSANSPEAIANGAVPGQVHFFPALCNTKQLRAEFERRGCAKLD
jgi:hypothetical protein